LEEDHTPLHIACEDHTDIVKELLAHPKIDPNLQGKYGRTPLDYACRKRHTHIVKAFLAHPNIDVNIRDKIGQTPLHIACEKGRTEIVKAFLTLPDIDVIQDVCGRTPLHYACRRGYTEITTMVENFIKRKKEKEQQLTQEFCLAMIQPHLPVSTIPKKRKAKELRRDELRLGSDIIKEISSYLEWKDISKKSCFEIKKEK
jgi:ankyrin repeat protein